MMNALERLSKFGIQKHDDFDATIWRQESFHNSGHIKANRQMAVNLIEAAMSAEQNNIFNLPEQLEKWNKQIKAELTIKDFQKACYLGFSLHDLGNIGDWGDQGFKFFSAYQGQKAEERSKKIARNLIKAEDFDKAWQKLVLYLIGQTKFNRTGENPDLFGRFIRAIDQLSTSLNVNKKVRCKRSVGLVKEIKAEKKSVEINPNYIVNFAYKRVADLLPQGTNLKQFANLAGFDQVPIKLVGVSDKKLPAGAAIAEIINAFD